MQKPIGKMFIAALLGVALALTGTALFSEKKAAVKDAPTAVAQTTGQQYSPAAAPADQAQSTDPATGDQSRLAGFQEGYRAGYQDAQRDCTAPQSVAPAAYSSGSSRRSYSRPARVRVAGQRYYTEGNGRNNHSTRNMILRIAGPAALGAGIGAIAGGKRGAGAGALIGGGTGALWQLYRGR